MKQKEIDIKKIIFLLFEKKNYVLLICILFSLLAFVYGNKQIRTYEVKVNVPDAPLLLFTKFSKLYNEPDNLDNETTSFLAKNFNQYLKFQITMSEKNFIGFIKKYNNEEFKIYSKDKNINFLKSLQPEIIFNNKNKNEEDAFVFTFQEPMPGSEFIEDYINFSIRNAESEFIDQLVGQIKYKIDRYTIDLEIAKKIDLTNPVYQKNNFFGLDPTKSYDYLQGSIVLAEKINNLNQTLEKIKEMKIDYEPIIKKNTKLISPKPIAIYIIAAMFLGIILCTIIIVGRYFIFNK